MHQGSRTKQGLIDHLNEFRRLTDTLRGPGEDSPLEGHRGEPILDSLVEKVIYHDLELRILWANRAACNSAGSSLEELLGRHCYEVWAQRREPCENCPVQRARETGRRHSSERVTPDGRRWFVQGVPVRGRKGDIVGMVEVVLDITAHRRAEAALRWSEQKYQRFLDRMGDAAYEANDRAEIIYANPMASRLSGVPLEELVGRPFVPLLAEESRKIAIEAHQRTLDGESQECELTFANGRIAQFKNEPLRDQHGNIRGVFGIARDVTRRKRAEAAITAALQEKELLLGEIHHRVKNNLQIISSLLTLTRRQTQNQEAAALLEDARAKVHTMALIHRQLYHQERFECIDMGSYTGELMAYLSHLYWEEGREITRVIEASGVSLRITQAVPCGLVLNELISNALKHAFPGRDRGTVAVSIRRTNSGAVRICVKDDGVGFPDRIDPDAAGTLGLQLVKILIERQLGGKFQLESNRGTAVMLEFADGHKGPVCM
jgi:hypothetical protein